MESLAEKDVLPLPGDFSHEDIYFPKNYMPYLIETNIFLRLVPDSDPDRAYSRRS